MSNSLNESLSALMDDEANELELERVLSRLKSEPDLRNTLSRYSMARTALRGERAGLHGADISERVREQVAQEAGARGANSNRFRRPFASFAVAASVAVAVVFGGQQLTQLGPDDGYNAEPSLATRASPVGMLNTLGAVAVPARYGTQAVPVLQPATRTAYRELARQRMGLYMQEHAEHAALNSPQGLIPFARVPQIRE